MKSLIIFALAALGASSPTATVTSVEPMEVQSFEGQEVQIVEVNLTVEGVTRSGRRPALTFYATSLVQPFISGFAFCKSRKWNLASPKSDQEQVALEAVIAEAKFSGDTWLGSMCIDERWAWLSDDSRVTFNKFPTVGGLVGPTPSCGNETQVLVMFSPTANNLNRWFKWGVEDMFASNHVVCQGSERRWRRPNKTGGVVVSVSNTVSRIPFGGQVHQIVNVYI